MVYSERPEPDVGGRDLAQGGIVSGPTLSMIGTGAPETVIPLNVDRDVAAEVMADPLNPNMSAVEFWDKILGHRCNTECDKRHYGRVRLVLDGDRYRVAEPPMIPWSADWDELAGLI